MADIAELGFRVNSAPLVKVTDDLNKLAPAAVKAERATDKFNHTAGAGRSAVQGLATGAANAASAVGRLAANMPTASVNSFTTSVKGATVAANGLNATVSNFNAGGIAAQFQDIAITSQMGMNPLIIALQQGTQLSGQLSQMQGNLWKNLAAGLASVISPLSILTIGFVGLLAVGVQFVKWGKVAETVLNTMADGLEIVAPYAAVAAAGLALLYAPALIMGLTSVIALLGRLAAQVVITAVTIAAANPVGAIILGLALAATALVIFRDEVAQILGFDIVQAAQDGINWIIGAFVGAFNGIKATWALLPAAIGDLTIQAANATIGAVEGMINGVSESINGFIRNINDAINMIPENLRGGFTGIGEIGAVTFGRVANPNEGAASGVAGQIGSAMDDAQGIDYVGQGVAMIQQAASGAADAMRGLATAAGAAGEETEKASKAAEQAAENYRKVTDGAREFIAEQQLEAQALGMSTVQANSLRYAQQLLNEATRDGQTVTAAQRAELTGLAGQMAQAEEATRSLTEAYEFGKSTFGSFLSDMRSELMSGASLWDSFAKAASNALDSIASRALDMAANGIWDLIFGAVTGGLTGGMGGVSSITGSSGGFFPGFEGGGDTGNGIRSGGVDGRGGFMAVLHPNETVTDNTSPANDNSGSGFVYQDNRSYSFGDSMSRADIEEILENDRRDLLASLPDTLNTIRADPRKRRSATVR